MNRGLVYVKAFVSIVAILVIGAGFLSAAYILRLEEPDSREAELKVAHTRLVREIEIAGKRQVPIRLSEPILMQEDRSILSLSANNAIAIQDLDGFQAVITDLNAGDARPSVPNETLRSIKVAGSDLIAARARKRRFETDRLMDETNSTRVELAARPNSSNLVRRLEMIVEMREILVAEYFADLRRSIELDRANARAFYDLARFYQDRRTRPDDLNAIRYFERAEGLMRGKMEKDADFVRAILNLTVLHHAVGNITKAKCYAAETIEKYNARSDTDVDYLFGVDENGNLNEPEFIKANDLLNPQRSAQHPDCRRVDR